MGIVGAFGADLVLAPLLGINMINQDNLSLPAMLVSLEGAVILAAAFGFSAKEGWADSIQ